MQPPLHPSDEFSQRTVLSSQTVYDGLVWNVLHEQVQLGADGPHITRDYVNHPGAVAVAVLDERDRILLVNQYRHPVGMTLWELPAGLLDVEGEPPLQAAQRELWEEADRTAAKWAVLTDFFLSPGSSSEAMRIFLARDSRLVPEADRHERTDEEAEMKTSWVALDDALAAVLGGRIHNPSAVVGILAAHAARAQDYAHLRPADEPFDAHPGLRAR